MTQRRIYQDEFPYFVTFRTREGLSLFEDSEYAEMLAEIMFKTCAMKGFDILSYQMMLDHVHALFFNIPRAHPAEGALAHQPKHTTAGTAARARRREYTISELMHGIKSYFAKELRVKYDIPYSILQPRFYTRIIDTDRYLRTIVEYITYNPTEADLPAKYREMPYQFVNVGKINGLL